MVQAPCTYVDDKQEMVAMFECLAWISIDIHIILSISLVSVMVMEVLFLDANAQVDHQKSLRARGVDPTKERRVIVRERLTK